MSAMKCPACMGQGGEYVYMRDYGYEGESQWSTCDTCGGTGKVWPSVEGEIVVETEAHQGESGWVILSAVAVCVPGPGRYRAIVQKIGEEKP